MHAKIHQYDKNEELCQILNKRQTRTLKISSGKNTNIRMFGGSYKTTLNSSKHVWVSQQAIVCENGLKDGDTN